MSISTFLRTILSPRRMRASLDAHQPRPYLADLEKFATYKHSEEFPLLSLWSEFSPLMVGSTRVEGPTRQHEWTNAWFGTIAWGDGVYGPHLCGETAIKGTLECDFWDVRGASFYCGSSAEGCYPAAEPLRFLCSSDFR